MSLEKLKGEVEWFLKNAGCKAYPFLRMYLRVTIEEAMKAGATQEQIDEVINDVSKDVARELKLDSWVT